MNGSPVLDEAPPPPVTLQMTRGEVLEWLDLNRIPKRALPKRGSNFNHSCGVTIFNEGGRYRVIDDSARHLWEKRKAEREWEKKRQLAKTRDKRIDLVVKFLGQLGELDDGERDYVIDATPGLREEFDQLDALEDRIEKALDLCPSCVRIPRGTIARCPVCRALD